MKAVLATLALLLAACTVSRPEAARLSFLVHAEYAGTPLARARAASLAVGPFEVAPPFDGRSYVYRRDEVRYETDFYNGYAAEPSAMLAEAAAAWLRRSGLFGSVTASAAGAAEHRLQGRVAAMYVDFSGKEPAAVLNIGWRLRTAAAERTVLALDCEERVRLNEISPRGVALAQGEALEKALAKLERALSDAL